MTDELANRRKTRRENIFKPKTLRDQLNECIAALGWNDIMGSVDGYMVGFAAFVLADGVPPELLERVRFILRLAMCVDDGTMSERLDTLPAAKPDDTLQSYTAREFRRDPVKPGQSFYDFYMSEE